MARTGGLLPQSAGACAPRNPPWSCHPVSSASTASARVPCPAMLRNTTRRLMNAGFINHSPRDFGERRNRSSSFSGADSSARCSQGQRGDADRVNQRCPSHADSTFRRSRAGLWNPSADFEGYSADYSQNARTCPPAVFTVMRGSTSRPTQLLEVPLARRSAETGSATGLAPPNTVCRIRRPRLAMTAHTSLRNSMEITVSIVSPLGVQARMTLKDNFGN